MIRAKSKEWALGLLWGLAAAGALTILVSLAIGAKSMLTAGSLTASVGVLVGPALANQARPPKRAPIRTPGDS